MMNDLKSTKLFITLGIFLISFISSASPMKVIHVDSNLFSIGNMLASGVLLAAGLVHQLPDSMEALTDISDFPLATFIAGIIFCFFLIIEEYIHTQFKNPFDNEQQSDANALKNLVVEDKKKTVNNNNNNNTTHTQNHNSTIICDHSHNDMNSSEHTKLLTHKEDKEYSEVESIGPNCRISELLVTRSISITSVCGSDRESTRISSNGDKKWSSSFSSSERNRHFLYESIPPYDYNNEHPVHFHTDHLAKHARGSLTSSIILLLALSIHSIFEGLGIGISSTTTELTSISAAVLAHKAFAGYALGSAMVASGMKNQHIFILCAVFSVCGILGVFLGMILQDNVDPENSVPIGIIQAMVAGTFLYVSIVEIAMKELMTHRENSKKSCSTTPMEIWDVRKLVAFFIGYLMMSLLAIWV